ncbi:antibiotic biosynthesis monooxygenase [Streptomyces sp. NPDC013457]|uniref:antibiotic biosynthesis monooxygenase n=1 Tax=Streptomyces sp. NPDC013457 TaxID=3364866 RepID=UPI0036F57FEF
MEQRFVWVTTRRITPGALEEFEQAWRPGFSPDGLHKAYAYWTEDGQEITGVSLWDSKEACDAWRSSDAERQRRETMAPFVVEENEAFYRGGELGLPGR